MTRKGASEVGLAWLAEGARLAKDSYTSKEVSCVACARPEPKPPTSLGLHLLRAYYVLLSVVNTSTEVLHLPSEHLF